MTASSDPTEIQPEIEPLETERPVPGALNRLLQRIERLPIPYPAFCLGVLVVATALQQLILVLNFKISFWLLDIDSLLSGYVIAYSLALLLFVKRSARQSLRAFAPALDLGEAQYQHLQATLTSIPTGPALLTGLVVLAASIILNLVFASEALRADLFRLPVMITAVSSGGLIYSMVGILIYDLLRKLWLVGRIYAYARNLDLFNRRSLYAFSGLTVRILAGWLLLSYPNVLLTELWRSPAWLSITGLMLFLMLGPFAYTLLHIHNRIKAEKERLLFDVQTRLQSVFVQLHERMDKGDLQDLSQLKVLMDSLSTERDMLTRISTWPWESETLSGFFSVVLLPVGIWAFKTWATNLLGG